MPFVNKKQQAACYAQKRRNPNSTWDCKEWSAKTDQKHLPETSCGKGRCKNRARPSGS